MTLSHSVIKPFAFLMLCWMPVFAFAQQAKPSNLIDPMTIAKGAKAWGDNCNRCHNMRAPQELRDDQWRAVVTHMRIRAGLTGDDARDILTFLQESN